MQEIPFAKVGRNDPSASLPEHLYLLKVGTLCTYGYGPCPPLLLKYERLPNYIFVSTGPGNDATDLHSKPGNGIRSPKLYGSLNYLLNVNSSDNQAFNKTRTFIETKVTAMKLQGFNL